MERYLDMVDKNKNMNNAGSEGMQKEKAACIATRNKIKTRTDSYHQLKITRLNSLVGCVLTYGPRITPLAITQLAKLQSFYSIFIRSAARKWISGLEQKPIRNYSIRGK